LNDSCFNGFHAYQYFKEQEMPEMTHQKNPRYERWRWLIFGVTWLGYAGFYLTRKSLPVAKIGMLSDPNIHISVGVLGIMHLGNQLAYAIGQFLWGTAADKVGTRKIVLFGMLASVAVCLFMGLSTIVLVIGVLWFIQGLCQASGWAPLTKNVGYWFSRKERGRTYGWWCTNYAIGGMIAAPFAGYMAKYFDDWRYAFFAPAAALFLVWILFLILQKNRPEDIGLPPVEEYHGEEASVLEPDETEEDEPEGSWKVIGEVLMNRTVLTLGIVYFFLKPLRYAILFWGPWLIHKKLGTGIAKSGLISVLFELGGPLGVLSAGYISDKLFKARRMPICVICLLCLAVVLFSFNALTASGNVWILGGLLFMIGFFLFGPDSMIVGTAAVDFGTKKGASTAAGMINCLGSFGAILGVSLAGTISERYGWGILFGSFGVFILIAALILLPLWNAVPKSAKKNS